MYSTNIKNSFADLAERRTQLEQARLFVQVQASLLLSTVSYLCAPTIVESNKDAVTLEIKLLVSLALDRWRTCLFVEQVH